MRELVCKNGHRYSAPDIGSGKNKGCKTCLAALDKAYRQARRQDPVLLERARERGRKRQLERYRADPSEHHRKKREWYAKNRERVLADVKAKYDANAEEMRAKARARRVSNGDAMRSACADWRRRNPTYVPVGRLHSIKKYKHKRRAWIASGSPGVSRSEWQEICRDFSADGSTRCAYCGSSEKIQIDHVVPLAKGGRDDRYNVVPACARCNRSKSDSLIWEWHRFNRIPSTIASRLAEHTRLHFETQKTRQP